MSLKAGGASEHRWYFFHLAGLCFSLAMRMLPRRRRFAAAISIARAAVPFVRRTQAFREQRRGNVDGACEIALYFVLNTLTKNGTEFDPVIAVTGDDELRRALAAGKGVLVVSPHMVLSLLMVRFFHDSGYDPLVVAADPQMRVGGTTLTAQTVQPSPTFLVAIRTKLRAGRLVCGMPDRAEHSEGRTIEFATANGPIILAPALMQVAARCGAKVIFLKVHVEESRVVAHMSSMVTHMIPASESSADSADAITANFIKFVQAHVESRRAYEN